MDLLPILLIILVMMLPLFLLSRSQRKAQAKQQELVKKLGVGDEVRTHSGFYGLIVEEYDDVVVLESEDGTQTKWARMAIAMAVDPVEDEQGEAVEGETLEGEAVEGVAPEGADSREAQDTAAAGQVPGVTVADEDPREDGSARGR
ncbi:preprotein translocase subunit YajC [Brachybacterium paraconglomeratum]|uniref:preprotein translocase subunit YajC n=1 Tax=Brachybacterium paraconglomeratum TaxID=173362 RepID=UPI0021A3B289|nr:preprotein translocase subunit YajC [Brachybacterium paraconglomeratum]MCT1908717.1 preprotein translocase subunit YajC [Brachybacterium paraconglomeratum]